MLSFVTKESLVFRLECIMCNFQSFMWRLHGRDATTDHNKHNMTKGREPSFQWNQILIQSFWFQKEPSFSYSFIIIIPVSLVRHIYLTPTAWKLFVSNIILPAFCKCYWPCPLQENHIYSPIQDHQIRTLILAVTSWITKARSHNLYNSVHLAIKLFLYQSDLIPSSQIIV